MKRPFLAFPYQNVSIAKDPAAHEARERAFDRWFNRAYGRPFPPVELDASLDGLSRQVSILADTMLKNLLAPPAQAAESFTVDLHVGTARVRVLVMFEWADRACVVPALPPLPPVKSNRPRAVLASA